jgi:chromate reductase, NAD(P)H dehydrogenase (quinone)
MRSTLARSRKLAISRPHPVFSEKTQMPYDVAAFVGSVRKESLNLKLAHALIRLQPAQLKLEIVPVGGLALYNPDRDVEPPQEWSLLRARVKCSDAVLFVTPEHNRSVPAAMKNAIDIASRPYGANAWSGKPGAVITASPGAIGGFGSNHHLRQMLVFLNVPAMQQPEAYIGHADKLFDAENKLVNEETAKFLREFLGAFLKWIDANKAPA